MDGAEEKETTAKVEVRQIDPLYFVVRELDAIHKRIDKVEETLNALDNKINALDSKFVGKIDALDNKINALDSKFEGKLDALRIEIKDDIKELRSFMIKLTFSVAGIILAGGAILFKVLK